MKIKEIAELAEGEILGCKGNQDYEMSNAFTSDLMSDVLRSTCLENTLLITGLCNTQTIRTAEMADLKIILIGRDKQPDAEMIELAEDNEITIIRSKHSLFHLSAVLYNAGLKPLY